METKEIIKEEIELIIELMNKYYKNILDIDTIFIFEQIKKGC